MLALYVKFTKDICMYKASGRSLQHLVGLIKVYYLLRSYMVGSRRRKIDIYGWTAISAVGKVWLMHNTDAQCALKALNGREEAQTAEKKIRLNVSCLTHNKMFNIIKHQGNANRNHKEVSFYTCFIMIIIKKTRNNKCWWECREKGTLVHHWWKCKLVQWLWKIV